MENLDDFFSLIGEGKKKKEEEKKDLIGEVTLGDLFSSLSEEKKKLKIEEEKRKKEKEELTHKAKIFEKFLYSENSKENNNISEVIKVLEKELLNLKNTSYKSIDRLMKGICSDYDITPRLLHDKFKEKHNLIPDEWVKQQNEVFEDSNDISDSVSEEIKNTNIIESESPDKEELSDNIKKSMEILEQLNPEEEYESDSENEIIKLKKEMEQLRKMVYESVRAATSQGGGGEVRLEFLDDVDRESAKSNGKLLSYNSSTGKFIGTSLSAVSGVNSLIAGDNITLSGSTGDVTINATSSVGSGDTAHINAESLVVSGISTLGEVNISDLSVSGDATIVGVLTVGSSSLTLDGDSNEIQVGAALTLGNDIGLQYHEQFLHVAGFDVNNINASGIITASSLSGDMDFGNF